MYDALGRTPAEERYSQVLELLDEAAPDARELIAELDALVGQRLVEWTDHAAWWVAEQPRTAWERTVTARLEALEARS